MHATSRRTKKQETHHRELGLMRILYVPGGTSDIICHLRASTTSSKTKIMLLLIQEQGIGKQEHHL